MKTIFKDANLSKEFIQKGYVKCPFLTEGQLEQLKLHVNEFERDFLQSDYGICSTTDLGKPDVVKKVNDFVVPFLLPIANEYFENYQIILGNYLVKKPQQNTLIPMHQDWTFVDEENYFSMSIWCPLIDVDKNNGCLQVVPRSHRISKNLRPAPRYPNSFINVHHELSDYSVNLPMKAGEAIFYDHALLHASPINTSKNNRPAVILGLTHKDAKLKHYWARDFKNNDSEVILDEFDMPDQFFMDHIRGSAPHTSKLLNSFPYTFDPIPIKEFHQKMNEQ